MVGRFIDKKRAVLYKSIDTITEADLQALVSEGRREDSQLEFKLTLPGSNDDEKREFLKDVSAMTNSQVGDIIYGIREDRTSPEDGGKAAELVGIITAGAELVLPDLRLGSYSLHHGNDLRNRKACANAA